MIKKTKLSMYLTKKHVKNLRLFLLGLLFLKLENYLKGHNQALATIFFEPDSSSSNLASILRTEEQTPYWKTHNSATIAEVTTLIKINFISKQEFFGIGIREIINGIGITFSGKED